MLRRLLFGLLILTIMIPAPRRAPAARQAAADVTPGLHLEAADAAGVTLVLDTPAYEITAATEAGPAYQRLSVPGYEAGGEPGSPRLPQINALLGVPPGAGITLEVIDEEIRPVEGVFHLTPVPGPAPLEDDLTPGELAYQPDAAIFTADAVYPAAPARIIDEAWLRDQRVVRVALSPFQYNPSRGTLVWRPHLRVRVTFTGGGAGKAPGGGPGAFEPLLQGSLLNYAQARSWRSLPETPSHLRSASPNDGETRYKLVVDQDGLYRISYADFIAAGVPVDGNPQYFALSSQGQDVAIQVTGEADGSFDPGDSLLFYGQRFRGDRLADLYADSMADWLWLCGACELDGIFEKYTDENVYWLSLSSSPGLRMETVVGDPAGSGDPTPAYYTATVRAEQYNQWYTHHFTSEDTWFWERIQPGSASVTRTYTTTLTALASATVTATVRAEVVSRSTNAGHHTQFFLNGGSAPIDDAFWNGKTNYTIAVPVPQTDLIEGVNALDFVVRYNGASEDMYFNWYAIDYARQFEAENDRLFFDHDEPGTWKYQAAGFDSGAVTVLDLTYPLTPTRVLNPAVVPGGGAYTATFVATPAQGAPFFLSGAGAELSVKSITEHTPQDFSTAAAEYVFITPQAFYTTTQTLAAYRAGKGLTTLVVTTEELYNQFNFGIYHPIAFKNFLEYTFANWSAPPTYALLVGGGHWNFKGYEGYAAPPIYMPPNLAFVDPWQGEVDSANLLAAVVGDDILADVLIGRMPANSVAELETMVGKTIAYEGSSPAAWQENVVFAVDDIPDPKGAGDFVALAQNLMSDYLDPSPYFQGAPVYLNDYDPDNCGTPQGTRPCPNANQAITTTLNITGGLLVNYIGHASVNRWADEKMFINEDIPWLDNSDHLPVILSMACLDGYWIHPDQRPSLIVEMLSTPDNGAVSAFAATGLGVATGHDYLQRGFFSSLFDDGVWTLGAAAQNGKINLFTNSSGFNNDLLHTFTVFGDPALQLLSPYGVGLAPAAQAAQAAAGSSVFYDLQVINTGILTDTFDVEINGSSWPATPAPALVPDLAPGAVFTVSVQVDIPAGESGWDAAAVTVISQGDTSKAQVATLTTFTEAEQIFLPTIHR